MKGKEYKGDWEVLKQKISKEFAELNCESVNLPEENKEETMEKQQDPGEGNDEFAKDHKSNEISS